MSEEEPYRRGMVVVAHADDAEYGCSATAGEMVQGRQWWWSTSSAPMAAREAATRT